jgi:hypothetical protein
MASAYALNRSLRQSPLRQFGGGVSVLALAQRASRCCSSWAVCADAGTAGFACSSYSRRR